MQDTHMIVQVSRHSFASEISTTKKASQERANVKLIFENDAPSATLPQKEFAGSERRLLIRLEDYWQSLRQSSCGPFFEDFQPSRNPVPWENCFIAYVSGQGAELAFDHIGASIIALFKPDRTNLPDREWLLDTITSWFGEIGNVLETARPARGEGRFYRPKGLVALYRSVLLPFVDAKREPAYVIGATTYRLDPIPPALESSAAIL
jgi:hypothetical protein